MNINATIFAQAIVFAILVAFTMKFVWPPIAKALDERALTIAHGLAASDAAKLELVTANKRAEEELGKARALSSERLIDAERRAQALIEQAKAKATEESIQIIAAAQQEAQRQVLKAREALQKEVAFLAVKGAEQILKREITAATHADLLERLKAEL